MTSKQFHTGLRVLVHDTGEGYSVSEYFYDPVEITKIAAASRDKLFKFLLSAGAYVTVNRMLKDCPATTGAAAPIDFLKLEIGLNAAGGWVLPEGIRIGEAMVGQGYDCVFVRGGTFAGTATTAKYWAYPTSPLDPSDAPFTDFPDAFYQTLILFTATELLYKETLDVADRLDQLEDMFARSVQTLT